MALIFPHEFIAKTAIHSVKANLAKELVNRGMTQKDIAVLFDSQTSTISQYIGGTRGNNYELNSETTRLLNLVCDAIINNPEQDLVTYGISQICDHIIKEEYGFHFRD